MCNQGRTISDPAPKDPKAWFGYFLHGTILTTNLIERAFREVKRRTRPMGVFGNRDSMERILYAVFFQLNSKGQEIPSLPFTQNS
jgi:transposase-like protein